jgi:hypothetical protein
MNRREFARLAAVVPLFRKIYKKYDSELLGPPPQG